MTAIRAVIFDLDGVLIDAREWHYEALNRALAIVGFQISRHDHLSTYDGLSTSKKLEMLSVEQALPRSLHSFIGDLKQAYTLELVHARCKPVFQQEFALSRLKAANYLIGVASNSIRNTVEVMMKCSNLAPYLDVMLSNQDVQRPKPDPEIYLRSMERLGVGPTETLIVEDNDHGIKAARGAGAHVMRVDTPFDVRYDSIVANIRLAEQTAQ
jgi:beta-phosphoglucomutase-like phosphatase (HAD superfamily)